MHKPKIEQEAWDKLVNECDLSRSEISRLRLALKQIALMGDEHRDIRSFAQRVLDGQEEIGRLAQVLASIETK